MRLNRNMLIYPNLIINDIMAVTMRTFMPTMAASMTITAWEVPPRDELLRGAAAAAGQLPRLPRPQRVRHPGDIEAWNPASKRFASGGVEWNAISHGMGRYPQATDEEQMRAFWRRWRDQQEGVQMDGAR